MGTMHILTADGQQQWSWDPRAATSTTAADATALSAAQAAFKRHYAGGGLAFALGRGGAVARLEPFDATCDQILLVPPLVPELTPSWRQGAAALASRLAEAPAPADELVARVIGQMQLATGAHHELVLLRTLRWIHLDDEWQQLSTNHYLDVVSPSSADCHYRIPAAGGFVERWVGGRPVAWLRVGTAEALTLADAVLLHLVMIRGNESHYLLTAKHYPAD